MTQNNRYRRQGFFYLPLLILLLVSACRTSQEVISDTDNFTAAEIRPGQITGELPDYTESLSSVRGKGKAIVSEPGTTDRVTVIFESNHDKSLVTVKNGIGVEGGQILSDGDSLLVYNKIDKFARKVSIRDGDLRRINNLASLNILDLINFTVDSNQVESVQQNREYYRLSLQTGAQIYVDKKSGRVVQVHQPQNSGLPYSRIQYEAYSEIEGFMLPRRITIFSADRQSKVNLLVQSLEINPELNNLEIKLPDNISLYYR